MTISKGGQSGAQGDVMPASSYLTSGAYGSYKFLYNLDKIVYGTVETTIFTDPGETTGCTGLPQRQTA